MSTTVQNLDVTVVDVKNGPAADFRDDINDNFDEFKNKLENKVNSEVKPAIQEVQSDLGDWDESSIGTVTDRYGGVISKRKIFIGLPSEKASVASLIQDGDLWGEFE